MPAGAALPDPVNTIVEVVAIFCPTVASEPIVPVTPLPIVTVKVHTAILFAASLIRYCTVDVPDGKLKLFGN